MISTARRSLITCTKRIPRVVSALATASFSSVDLEDTNAIADKCDKHTFRSPYPPIPEGPYPPVYEFVAREWASFGDKTAIVDGTTGASRSFQDYRTSTESFAGALQDGLGILGEDSCVALYAPNHVDYVPVSLAAAITGAKLTPINPLFTSNELLTILERSGSSVLVTHTSRLYVALETVKDSSTVKHVIVLTDDGDGPLPEGTSSFESVVKGAGLAVSETNPAVHSRVDTHAYMLPYSSGTTGLPKGVMLSHRNIVANLYQCELAESPTFLSNHKLISPLPFFHIYGFLVSIMYSAWKGQQIITTSGRFDLETFCQLVQDHRPQRSHLVPPIILGLAKHPIVDKYDMSSLEQIISAAAPLGPEIEEEARNRLGCRIKQAWGMSELSPIGTNPRDKEAKTGSVGPLAADTEGKIVDEQGNSLPPGEVGELLIRGPQVMLGYLNAPDKTAECLSESGWLRTGDVALSDEDGYVYITDRLKELIKVRGYAVAPAELEALLLTHEHVQDTAVIQIPDEISGEVPRAYVVLKDTDAAKQVTEEDLKGWVKERVAAYKRLEGGVVFQDSIPKSPSGKILRRLLRDKVKGEMEESAAK